MVLRNPDRLPYHFPEEVAVEGRCGVRVGRLCAGGGGGTGTGHGGREEGDVVELFKAETVRAKATC